MRSLLGLLFLVLLTGPTHAQWVSQSGFYFSYGSSRFQITGFATGTFVARPCVAPIFRPWYPIGPRPLTPIVPQPVYVFPLPVFVAPVVQEDRVPRRNLDRWQVIRPEPKFPFPNVPRKAFDIAAPIARLEDRLPNPERESHRQIEIAMAAFAKEEYGRAIERFTEAIRHQPQDPRPLILCTQAHLARGEYTEAARSLIEALRLIPEGKHDAIDITQLYRAHPQRFNDHFAEFQGLARQKPDDVMLQFLLAFQLGNRGEPDDASALLRTLSQRVNDRASIDRLLALIERLDHRKAR